MPGVGTACRLTALLAELLDAERYDPELMTRMVAPIATAFVFAHLFSTAPLAQGQRNKFSTQLSSVKELHIETGPLSEQAGKCGLTVTDLESPVRPVLEASRLRVIQSASDFVFINANVVAVGDMCVAAIDVDLYRFANQFGASVSVWGHQAVIAGGKSGFNTRVRDKVDALAKEFTADWLKARQ